MSLLCNRPDSRIEFGGGHLAAKERLFCLNLLAEAKFGGKKSVIRIGERVRLNRSKKRQSMYLNSLEARAGIVAVVVTKHRVRSDLVHPDFIINTSPSPVRLHRRRDVSPEAGVALTERGPKGKKTERRRKKISREEG